MPSSAPPTSVELTRNGDIATIRFKSEKGVNIFSSRVMGELGEIIEHVAEDGKLRFVILRGEGRSFLAGADISEMSHFEEAQGRALATHGHRVLNAVENLPQVTIAAIHGPALGGGCELAMACDFRIATTGSKLGQPESRLGLIPGWGGTMRLPRLIGPARARRLLYSGGSVNAEEALVIGLIDEVVPSVEALDASVAKWIAEMTPGAPKAITRIKRALAHKDEIKEFACCFSCSDAREGMTAFLEKRPPNWTK